MTTTTTKKTTKTTKTTAPAPDAWMVLVLKSMSVAELEKESANTNNTDDERRLMLAEVIRRKGGR